MKDVINVKHINNVKHVKKVKIVKGSVVKIMWPWKQGMAVETGHGRGVLSRMRAIVCIFFLDDEGFQGRDTLSGQKKSKLADCHISKNRSFNERHRWKTCLQDFRLYWK